MQLKLSLAYPNHYRLDTTVNIPGLAGNALVVGYDGKTGWTSSPQGANDIPPAQYGEFIRRILLTGGVGLYQASQAGTVQVQAIGPRDFQGMKTDAVAVVSGSVHVVVYFDAATHLAAGARYQQDTPQGAVETIEVWSDYREVDGAKFPCHGVTLRNGQKFSEYTVQEIKFNTNPDRGAVRQTRGEAVARRLSDLAFRAADLARRAGRHTLIRLRVFQLSPGRKRHP